MSNYTYIEESNIFGEKFIRRNPDGAMIPANESNSDYQRYLRHLAGEDESGTLS